MKKHASFYPKRYYYYFWPLNFLHLFACLFFQDLEGEADALMTEDGNEAVNQQQAEAASEEAVAVTPGPIEVDKKDGI